MPANVDVLTQLVFSPSRKNLLSDLGQTLSRVDSSVSISLFFLSYIFLSYISFFPWLSFPFLFVTPLTVCLACLTRFSSLLTMTTAFVEWTGKTGSLIKEIVVFHSLAYDKCFSINCYPFPSFNQTLQPNNPIHVFLISNFTSDVNQAHLSLTTLVILTNLYMYVLKHIKKGTVDGTLRSKDILQACSIHGSKKKDQERRERVEQDCDGDQSFTDTQGRKEREREKKKHTHTVDVCVRCHSEVCEKKGQRSKERWDDGSKRGSAGKSGRYSQCHKTCAHSSFIVFCTIFTRMLFFHDHLPSFRLADAFTNPPTHKQTATTSLYSFTSAGQRKLHSHKTLPHSFTLRSWPQIIHIKKPSADAAESLLSCCITSCAGLAQVMNATRTDQKK